MVYGMRFLLNQKDKLEDIVDRSRKQGKSEEEIKQIVSLFLDEMKKKIKEEGLIF
jgi:hypothetical protein